MMPVPSTVTIAPDSGASRSGDRIVPEMVTRFGRSGTVGGAASVDAGGGGASSVTSVGRSEGGGDGGEGEAGGADGGACAMTVCVLSEATAIHARKDRATWCLVATGTSTV